jgi:hypothetical protein
MKLRDRIIWPTALTLWFCDFMDGYSKGLGWGIGVIVGVLAAIGAIVLAAQLWEWLAGIYSLSAR